MISDSNSTNINFQSWFILTDSVMIISTGLNIILASIFLFIILLDKTCHTVPMMLVANSCLAHLGFGSNMIATAIYTLKNDLNQIYFYDTICLFEGYFGYAMVSIQTFSYLLQAMYRYITVIYPKRLFWQSTKFQLFLICLTWIGGIIYPIPIVSTGWIIYHPDDQICQVPLRFSISSVVNITYVYMIPVGSLMLIYLKMILYIKKINKHVTSSNTLLRAKREMKMIRRIMILVSIQLFFGIPYATFILMSYFTSPPKYHFRIAFIFVDTSLVGAMIALFKFTDPVKACVMRRINNRTVVIIPTSSHRIGTN